MNKILMLILCLGSLINAQDLSIKGKVKDKIDNSELSFANIRLLNSNYGTAANQDGEFELKLKKGNHDIVISFIGYNSDTLAVNLTKNINLEILLNPTEVRLPELTVLPGENPALKIIEQAIKKKEERNEKITSYEFFAYTKGIVKTAGDLSSRDNSVTVGLGSVDFDSLKITGIIENTSRGYFEKPNNYKEEIIAQKQSANFPSSINLLTGSRVMQNFYDNDIEFFGKPLPGPLSDDALNYYYYYIKDTTAIDGNPVFEIYMEPENQSNPGFKGSIFIKDKTYDLIKVSLNPNSSAVPISIFRNISIESQFSEYEVYMPIDYRISAQINYLNIVSLSFEVNSIMYDYTINKTFKDAFFDEVVIKVLPEADKRDSVYWANAQTISNTSEELQAYRRIDSLESIPTTFWDNFSFLSTRTSITENFSTIGPLALYNFNRVEGHSLNLGAYLNSALNKRLYYDIDFNYGFADKRFKSSFSGRYLLGEYRNYFVNLKAYNQLVGLFESTDKYNKFTSTILSLFSKYDFRDYYYTTGFEFKTGGEIFYFLDLSAGYKYHKDKSANVNTDFSFFKRDRNYRVNKQIFDADISAVEFGYELDFRKIIEDGYFRRKTSSGRSYFTLSGNVLLSNKSTLKSDLDFQLYQNEFWGYLNSFGSTRLTVGINNIFANGEVPLQLMYALPGNISGLGKGFSFRTLRFGEVFGDKITSVNIQYNLNDELFRLLRIPFLKDSQLNLGVHYNTAWVDVTNKSMMLLTQPAVKFIKPFHEVGFSLFHPLLPMIFEFTWKLNYRGENNFVFGINTFAL